MAENVKGFQSREDAVEAVSLFASAVRNQEHLTVWANNKFLTHV